MVAGFMSLLNVAVITAVFGQTRVEPSGGVTRVTVGGFRGPPGFPAPAFLSGSPHPAIRTANKNAGIHILRTVNLRMRFSSSPSYKSLLSLKQPILYARGGRGLNERAHYQHNRLPTHAYCRMRILLSVLN